MVIPIAVIPRLTWFYHGNGKWVLTFHHSRGGNGDSYLEINQIIIEYLGKTVVMGMILAVLPW